MRNYKMWFASMLVAGLMTVGISEQALAQTSVTAVRGGKLPTPTAEQVALAVDSGSGTPSQKLQKLPENLTYLLHVSNVDGSSNSSVLATDGSNPNGSLGTVGPGERALYSNFRGTFLRPNRSPSPGATSFPISDDLSSDALEACDLQDYRVAVNGGIAGGGGTFKVLVSLWTDCPTPAGEGMQIPNTRVLFTGLDNDITTTHILEVVLDPADMIQVSGTVWMRVTFDNGEAGTIMGSPPDIGFSADAFGSAQSCESNNGGFPSSPHGSFNAELIGLDTCSFGFLAYQAVRVQSQGFNGGANVRYADDITLALGDSLCELATVEMGFVGGAGAYSVNVDFRQLGGSGPLQGTSMTFDGKGDLSLEIARFNYPPPPNSVSLPTDLLFITWKPTKGSTGPVIVGRTQAGFSAPTFSTINETDQDVIWVGPNALPPPDTELPAIFYVRIKCRGDAPLGACCPTQKPNEPADTVCTDDTGCPNGHSCIGSFCTQVECLDDVPVTSCFGGRWEFGTTCAQNTFSPPCGTHACCKPDNSCADEFFDDCVLVTDPDSPIETCTQDSDCIGGNRTCEPTMGVCNDNSTCTPGTTCTFDGQPCQRICSDRTAQWQPGDFCGFNFQQCPIFECFFGEGNCFEAQEEIVCNNNSECPIRQTCGEVPFNVCTAPRGCNDFTCCDEVCRTPGFFFCCDVGWDQSCSGVASAVCGDTPPSNDVCFERRCNEVAFTCTDDQFCISRAIGDSCDVDPLLGAIPISLDNNNRGSDNAFTNNATGMGDPAFCCSSNGFSDSGAGSIWFQVVVPAGETSMRVHTCLTPFSPDALDSMLQVHRVVDPAASDKKQQCEALEAIGCNDDSPTCGGSGGLSDLCLDNLIPGETLFIQVAGASGASAGTYQINVEFPCTRLDPGNPDAAPANDTCDNAEGLPLGQSIVSVPFDVSNSTVDCPRPTDTECTAMVNDVWFSYISSCTGTLFVDTCDPVASNTDPATTLAAYRTTDLLSPCPPSTFFGCNDDAIPNALEHQRRAQTCSMSLVACDDDADCLAPKRCEATSAVCATDFDCSSVNPTDTCVPDICESSCAPGSTLMVPVTTSGQYRIQVGGEFGAEPSGMLNLECVPQDCQLNFLSDLGEIQNGSSLDCNSNFIPDECDIDVNSPAPGGPYFCTGNCVSDCNNNGIPDECDLASGVLTDVAPADGIPDECGGCPDGTVTFDNPADGTIDARQPHPIGNNAAAQGFNMFVVTAPGGADGPACWSLCETSARNFTPNAIASVVDNGNGTVTLTLNRGITGGEVTRIAYTSSSNVVTTGTFIAHPGNVNGDSVTNASDITALVDALNNVTPRPIYRTDLNRSGVFNASDLTRLIDLLNGANAFSPWLSAAKPTGTCTP